MNIESKWKFDRDLFQDCLNECLKAILIEIQVQLNIWATNYCPIENEN